VPCSQYGLSCITSCVRNFTYQIRTSQVLPVERGRGMDQPGMRAAERRLAAGDWVHIFPEGTRSRDGQGMGPLR